MKFMKKYAGYLFLLLIVIFCSSLYFVVLSEKPKLELKPVELIDNAKPLDEILKEIDETPIDEMLKGLKL